MARNPLAPISKKSWDAGKALHLLNRAGFGIPRGHVGELVSLRPQTAVDSLVHYEGTPVVDGPPTFIDSEEIMRRRIAEVHALPAEERRARTRQSRKDERGKVRQLKAWWLARMVDTGRPLEEKMTLFWHGHFATSAQKVHSSYSNLALNETFRRHATGNVRGLTVAVGQSPAMLNYLDNRRNKKGHPNENWARALMELFTMGPGNYTEEDIQESARAFTGWSVNRDAFVNRKKTHDTGRKTFLGRSGNFDGNDIIGLIFQERAMAAFLSRKLWTYFAYENTRMRWLRNSRI